MNGASATEPQYKPKCLANSKEKKKKNYMVHVSSSKVLALALLVGPKF